MTERIIAIGDVHGCAKALATLIEAIQPTPQDTFVFVGDYIDRGPDSRGVVEQVVAVAERCTVVPLLGNHEEMLLAALEGGQSEVRYWMKFGGDVALASYGWKGEPDLRPADLRSLIPRGHVEFLKRCRDYFETVHTSSSTLITTRICHCTSRSGVACAGPRCRRSLSGTALARSPSSATLRSGAAKSWTSAISNASTPSATAGAG